LSREAGEGMGHLTGKDLYRNLGRKIDSLTVRTPWNKTLYSILSELYTPEEADVVTRMPCGLSPFARIRDITGYESGRLEKALNSLSSKGLVLDIWAQGEYFYAPSPLMIGIFEFTMMRAGDEPRTKKIASLFHEYLQSGDHFYRANFGSGEKTSIIRALPHEEAVRELDHVEILDYEKAAAIVDSHDKFSIGPCSCRHEKSHLDNRKCDTPLETCSSFGMAAEYLVRHGFAREASKFEMMANIRRSRELGLVLSADNVKKNVTFMCHCCKCCCNVLLGITRFGYANTMVTSTFISATDEGLCTGCGKCAEACPADAITMIPPDDPKSRKKRTKTIDSSLCLGCGVCALRCGKRAIFLVKRGQRVLHPETTFERIILQCLERGTLQNQMFDNPRSITHRFLRALVGAALSLPAVKRALLSEALRSRFLSSMEDKVRRQGKGWALDI
jgi:NAD-dependent dihydropyrimidine dehydrogenase PreA subunit